MAGTALAVAEGGQEITRAAAFTQRQVEIMRTTLTTDLNDDEFAYFASVVQRSGLDPFSKQIWGYRGPGGKVIVQASIDGLRAIAVASGEYEGQVGPQWCGDDGQWRDVWLSDVHPAAARVGVLRAGFREPLYAVALWREYVRGEAKNTWATHPSIMLAKCSEAIALRRAFPREMVGLYGAEELDSGAIPATSGSAAGTQVQQRTRTAAKPAGNGARVTWPGPGQCPSCNAPAGKTHGAKCANPVTDTQPVIEAESVEQPAPEPPRTNLRPDGSVAKFGDADYDPFGGD